MTTPPSSESFQTPHQPSTKSHSRWSSDPTGPLIDQLVQLRDRMDHVERIYDQQLQQVDPGRRASAKNLLQYVTLRQQDLRSIQQELSNRGLSSLGRCEANVRTALSAVIEVLRRLAGREPLRPETTEELDFEQSRQLVERSTAALFGLPPSLGAAHIMVTMPSEAADDPNLIRDLVAQGMDCMRVNCAHDDAQAWKRMINNLRRACEQQGRACKVLMDLGGPKLRTGRIEPGPQVLKWRPNTTNTVVCSARRPSVARCRRFSVTSNAATAC
ncbi:pyruvate kinase [Rhodopirellula sp. JC639]|uniref:pyruvate kinase n=1 Tax=Stieleria mannarensis TaxID=2755585 RepID=UPI001603B49F|nr:pyruvate kinase [Rhodopirellula sp. JC639]